MNEGDNDPANTKTPEDAHLADLFQEKQKALESDLSAAKQISHPDATGDVTELNWIKFFRSVLPDRYSVRKAFVVDSRDQRSEENDVVIFDTQYSPLLMEFGERCFVPAESVWAVFEVKQELSKSAVEYAGKKVKSVRSLYRTSVDFPTAGGRQGPIEPFTIAGGILTMESSWSPPFGSSFENSLRSLDPASTLNIGLALQEGIFTGTWDGAQLENLDVVEADSPLPIFLLRLLDLLRELATVPAIDYDAYIEDALQG